MRGADLSHRRAGAKTCDALCRKRLSRGAITAPRPAAPVRSRRLIDEIDERARERHLAWSTPRPDRALIGDLDAALEGLYAELRRRRATQPLSIGHSASVVAHAPPLARPWPSTQGAHRTRELEVVT
jgi:hypothetical protein